MISKQDKELLARWRQVGSEEFFPEPVEDVNNLVRAAVAEEREACLMGCMGVGVDLGTVSACVSLIRARGKP